MFEPFVPPTPVLPLPASPAPEPIASPRPVRRRRRDVGLMLAASMLSAALASGATIALVPRPAASIAADTSSQSAAPTNSIVTVAANTTSSVASVVASDSPAVVTIQTTISAAGSRSRSASGTGVGSGFIYASDGYILTAAHVVEGASQITVTLADGRTFTGTVASSNSTLDVAVVKIAATGLPTLSLGNASKLQIGQTVMAIGDPLGEFPGSVTVGIVSGTDRSITVADDLTGQAHDLTGLVQTDAAINPGNSGGPLVDSSGAVIGIINAGSASAQGIGFAVPISAAAGVMASTKTI